MGQRHQIYLKTINPIKEFNRYNELSDEEVIELEKTFGTGETTVLAFHNQWLFGRTALLVASNVLQHISQFGTSKKLDIDSGVYHTPFSLAAIYPSFSSKDRFISSIEFILNYIPKNTSFIPAGFLTSFFLNSEEPEHRTNCAMGDNNDGITIIDTIENKYCFMNINRWYKDAHSASKLQPFKPCTAHEYVSAYYGETLNTCNPYHIDRTTKQGATTNDLLVKHAKDNLSLINKLKKFSVLTKGEVLDIFPEMKKEFGSLVK